MKSINRYVEVFIIITITVILDLLLRNYFEQIWGSSNNTLILDVIVIGTAFSLGKAIAVRLGLPIWYVKYSNDTHKKQLYISIIFGSLIVIINTLIFYTSDVSTVSWVSFSSVLQIAIISLRAALTEEIIYRLLFFSAITWIISRINKSMALPLIAGAVISSFFFGLNHPGFYIAFINAVLLCYIYRYNGLAAAMLIHFIADAIPFTLIYIRLR